MTFRLLNLGASDADQQDFSEQIGVSAEDQPLGSILRVGESYAGMGSAVGRRSITARIIALASRAISLAAGL